MIASVIAKSGLSIRLTDERWQHILDGHGELADWMEQVLQAVAEPDRILAGGQGELLAVKEIEIGKWVVVVYRELQGDGFIITAFFTRQVRSLAKRKQL